MNNLSLTHLPAIVTFSKARIYVGNFFVALTLQLFFFPVSGQVTRSGSGANAAAIQTVVDQFRTDLGLLNSNVAGSFGTGRRQINWDGVPDASAAPNSLPANFFNVTSPRGAILSTAGTGLEVSANVGNATATPTEFANINPNYTNLFAAFSAQRLFTAVGSNITDVTFYFPGSTIAAQVRGFGAVFSDVDLTNVTSIQYFDKDNVSLGTFFVPAASGNKTFSFLGVSYPAAVISRVRITCGNAALGVAVNESAGTDLVVMDDFIYAEPISGQVTLRSGAGLNAAAIQPFVDQYRNDLGTLNANVAGSFGTGRREINWDGVPDAFATPNQLPLDFFNSASPRGVIFATPGTGVNVSANSSNPTSTPVEFNNFNPTYSTLFAPFSPQRLFTPVSANITDVTFYVPGSATTALTRGLGSVFSDVDLSGVTSIQYFDRNNVSLGTYLVPAVAGNETFSFLGISYPMPTVFRVRITTGNSLMGITESPSADLVVMDDFVYGEPVSLAVLPITFTVVKAVQKNNGIEVQWRVETENNAKEYQVQKSNDGRNFNPVGNVPALNNSFISTYNWVDTKPNNSINYFRIKAISNSGEIKYSEIIRISTRIADESISIYPNPLIGTNLNVHLNNKVKGDYAISLYNNSGQMVYNKVIIHDGGSSVVTIQLPIASSNGVYQLNIKNPDGTHAVIKLMVTK